MKDETIEAAVIRLLDADARFENTRIIAGTVGVDIDGMGLDLFDIALDLLGVPPDTTCEDYDPLTLQPFPTAYSRDWALEEWVGCGHQPGRFVVRVKAILATQKRG